MSNRIGNPEAKSNCITLKQFDQLADYWLNTLIICSIISVLANSAVIALVLSYKKLRTIPNFFIVNMCASDLLVPIFFLSRYLIFFRYNVVSLFFCKFVAFFLLVSMAVSVQSLLVISVHRFYAVVLPIQARIKKKTSKCTLMIAFIWLFSIAISVPEIIYRNLYSVNSFGKLCLYSLDHQDWIVYHLFLVLALVAVPFVTMSVLYTAIVATLYKLKKQFRNLQTVNIEIRRKRNLRLTRFLIAAVFNFFVFYGVYWIVLILNFGQKTIDYTSCNLIVYYAVTTFPAIYSTINPIMYFAFWKNYRRAFVCTLNACFEYLRLSNRNTCSSSN